jgi:hypothetical protein
MSINQIHFKINEKEKIITSLKYPLDEIDCCDNGILILKLKNNKKILFNDALYYGIQKLCVMLQKTLQYQLLIDESITDIGYLYNEEIQNKSGLFYTQLEGRKFWIGRMYHLWTYKDITTWIYNDNDQNIIFEVTPIYPGNFSTSKKAANIILYNDWIKTYKPYFIGIIAKEIAEQWIEKASGIINQIDKNIVCWRTQEVKMSKNRI